VTQVAVYSLYITKHINRAWTQTTIVHFITAGTYSDHRVVRG